MLSAQAAALQLLPTTGVPPVWLWHSDEHGSAVSLPDQRTHLVSL